jgi:hypothetical protein
MKNLTINGRNYSLYNVTGKVVEASKMTQQEIKSIGGGPYSSGQQIKTFNTVKDQVFLIDNEGNEHSFQLVAMNIACRESNEITVTCVKQEKINNIVYIAALNKTTNQMFFSQPQINGLHLPSKKTMYYFMGIIALLLLIVGAGMWLSLLGGAFFGWLFSLVYMVIKSPIDGKVFTKNFRIEDYN